MFSHIRDKRIAPPEKHQGPIGSNAASACSVSLNNSPPLDVRLRPYDARWPMYFRREALRIEGSPIAPVVRVEHVGSTAVCGMSSKPIVDLLVGFLYGKTTLTTVADSLVQMGYRTYQPVLDAEWRMLWRRTGDIPVHVHMVPWDSSAWKTYIAFREVLRRHPDVSRAYKARKEVLVRRYAKDASQYSMAKRSFVSSVLARYAFIRWPD
jgi:GrpB-like predicted nucleotidyltransferase (UPF0157 family)